LTRSKYNFIKTLAVGVTFYINHFRQGVKEVCTIDLVRRARSHP